MNFIVIAPLLAAVMQLARIQLFKWILPVSLQLVVQISTIKRPTFPHPLIVRFKRTCRVLQYYTVRVRVVYICQTSPNIQMEPEKKIPNLLFNCTSLMSFACVSEGKNCLDFFGIRNSLFLPLTCIICIFILGA